MSKSNPKASVKLSAWELVVIEEALRNGVPHADKASLEALLKKIESAVLK